MIGKRPVGDIWVHIAGIDLVRTDADDFYVLEDNARTPSGVSYMLENREVMLKLVPELFAKLRIRPVETYPDQLLDMLHSIAPPAAGNAPTAVLLDPQGTMSATYNRYDK